MLSPELPNINIIEFCWPKLKQHIEFSNECTRVDY